VHTFKKKIENNLKLNGNEKHYFYQSMFFFSKHYM